MLEINSLIDFILVVLKETLPKEISEEFILFVKCNLFKSKIALKNIIFN